MRITHRHLRKIIRETMADYNYDDDHSYDCMLSELITSAQKALAEHGDMPVLISDGYDELRDVRDLMALNGAQKDDPNYSLPSEAPSRMFFLIGPDA